MAVAMSNSIAILSWNLGCSGNSKGQEDREEVAKMVSSPHALCTQTKEG